ncbi:MAG: LLM class flavin-dependent oxidoreductase [Actinomycetota bacterium]|nr:LLM class flavin-dependent oxidoreductase [Actinomycetota bacterium]
MGEAREIEAPSGRLGILMPGMGRERRPPPAFADLVAATSLWVLGFAAVAASSRRSHAGSEALRPRRLLPRPPRSYTPHADETSQDRGCRMDYGVHLPLIDLDGRPWSLQRLLEYVETAEGLGFEAVCANDHLVFSRPWLDGHTALAAVLAATGKMDLMTTVALPVVRGPVALAKSLAAIDILSGSRLIVGVGPGSSARDYAAAGIPFEERWKRLDEAVGALRALWREDGSPFKGEFYSTEGIVLEPHPAQPPPIWIGSWGSEAGLRRTARLGDGWLASAYNTTPEAFADARRWLGEHLRAAGKDPDRFPSAVATMFLHVTEDRATAQRIVRDVLSPMLGRPEIELHQLLLVGPAEECAEKIIAYREAGVRRLLIWPVEDELRQLTAFWEWVVPLVRAHDSPDAATAPARIERRR